MPMCRSPPFLSKNAEKNGGFAPYGYQLIDGKLIINEEEAIAIRTILISM